MRYAIYRTNGTCDLVEGELGYKELSYLVSRRDHRDGHIFDKEAQMIEHYVSVDGADLYINEEGRLIDLPKNPFWGEDLRGDVIEVGGHDSEGEIVSLPEDYVLRRFATLPDSMFVAKNKFTIFFIADSFPITCKMEMVTTGEKSSTGKPIFILKGKRKKVVWSFDLQDIIIFEGHDVPFTTDSEMKTNMSKIGHTIRMNCLYNFGGCSREEMRRFILEKQVNPFWISLDRVCYIDEQDGEELLFPHAPPSSQRIADMQSKQLKDGVARVVVGG